MANNILKELDKMKSTLRAMRKTVVFETARTEEEYNKLVAKYEDDKHRMCLIFRLYDEE